MVITDIRFDEEVEWLRAREGRLIVVIRNNGVEPSAPQHSSEYGVRTGSADRVVYNTGTLDELYAKVDILALELAG
jgi:hypothetical protein